MAKVVNPSLDQRPRNLLLLIAIYFAQLLFLPLSKAGGGGVELHAHLFMKEGMTWVFNGSFNGPLKAKSWKDGLSSQTNPETLERSGLDIIVVALYANPFFTLSLRDSIRSQIALAERFTQEHPNWVLAKNPAEAKVALASQKHVLILGLEGASGILETEEDIREFVDQDGIRIVTLLHLTDDEFGGVAFLKGFRALSSPLAFLSNLFHPMRDSQGNRVNTQGLTEQGRQIVTSLLKHHVWIDLAHSSDATQRDLFPILAKAKHPLLYTHTALRQYHPAERSITLAQLHQVSKSNGYVGLMPSELMLESTPTPSDRQGSVQALAVHFDKVAKIIGENSVSLGSDFNGGITHLKPSFHTGTSLDQSGFWNIGQTQEIWKALKHLGVSHPISSGNQQTLRFLEVWSKLYE